MQKSVEWEPLPTQEQHIYIFKNLFLLLNPLLFQVHLATA